MSAEIISLFTAGENIRYLYYYLNKNLKDNLAKEQILENLIENIFNFNDYNTIENDIYIRRSEDRWNEVRKLNKSFIENRIALYNQYNDIGKESYHMQSFIDDSLFPKGYTKLNEPYHEDYDRRIFRYEDKHNPNRSKIPIQQILSRGDTETECNEAFYDSEYNLTNKMLTEPKKIDYLNTLMYNNKDNSCFDI